MTQEKEKGIVELEKFEKKAGVVATIGMALMLVGGMIVLWSIVSLDEKMIPDNEHMTDQNMPIRDIKNATYTWTSEEIDQMVKEKADMLLIGAFLIAPGTALLYAWIFISPSKRKMHEIGCKQYDDVKYCPKCGLKLEKE